MRPQDVDSPKDRLSELNIVHTAAEGWSVATCMWLEEDGTKDAVSESAGMGVRTSLEILDLPVMELGSCSRKI